MIDNVIDDLKSFNWKEIISKGKGLKDLNDKQWRFMKGLVAELIIEKYSKGHLTYVGTDHKDYEWQKHNISVELKSQFSDSMYGKRGNLCENFVIKLNNSNGTNNTELSPSNVADILIVVRDNGAFVIDKNTILDKASYQGDGFSVKVNKKDIIEITGKLDVDSIDSNFKEMIINGIKQGI